MILILKTSNPKKVQSEKPEAYVNGKVYFYNEVYIVTPDVLIPRPDTERVVDKVVEYMPNGGKLLDLCTGSGCIGISTLNARPDCTCVAVDISESAIEIAKQNAVLNGVDDRIKFIVADINTVDIIEKYDIIVSNPPYVKTDEISELDSSVKDYEPHCALDGGDDGLDFYRLILNKFKSNVKTGGLLIFEIGYNQAEDMKKLCADMTSLKIYKDYGGNDRVAVINV